MVKYVEPLRYVEPPGPPIASMEPAADDIDCMVCECTNEIFEDIKVEDTFEGETNDRVFLLPIIFSDGQLWKKVPICRNCTYLLLHAMGVF